MLLALPRRGRSAAPALALLLAQAFTLLCAGALPAGADVDEATRTHFDAAQRRPALSGRALTRYARLGASDADELPPDEARTAGASLTGSVQWQASASCLSGALHAVVAEVASRFGAVRVGSTCRSAAENRSSGGAAHSYHLSGEAVDFRVFGNAAAVRQFLAAHGSVGGLKHYGGGLFHIDSGPRRPF